MTSITLGLSAMTGMNIIMPARNARDVIEVVFILAVSGGYLYRLVSRRIISWYIHSLDGVGRASTLTLTLREISTEYEVAHARLEVSDLHPQNDVSSNPHPG